MNNKTFICPVCGNSDPTYIGFRNGHPYCRKCVTFRGQEPINEFKQPVDAEYELGYRLSEEQKALSRQLLHNFKNHIDSLVHAVCGAGKTEICLAIIKYAIENGMKVGFATPRRDVVRELYLRFKNIFVNNKVVSIYGGHVYKLEGDLICLTTHQLFRYNKYFDLLILDEIDAFPYQGNEILQTFFKRAIKGHYVLMSATPSKEVVNEFKQKGKDILRLNKRFHNHPLPVPTISIHRGIMRYYHLIKELRRFSLENKPVFVFAPTIDECEQVYNAVRLIFSKTDYVHSKCVDRNERIEKFKDGKTKILITTAVLERGVTFKNLQVIIFDSDHPLYTSAALIQISGRVGRKKDAPTGEVIFIARKKTNEMVDAINEIEFANQTV